MKVRILLMLFVFSTSLIGLEAEAHNYKLGQIKLWYPAGWKTKTEGPVFAFTDPGENVPFMVFPLPVKTP